MRLQVEIKTSFAEPLVVGSVYLVEDIMSCNSGYYQVQKSEPDKLVLVNCKTGTPLTLKADKVAVSRYEFKKAKVTYSVDSAANNEKTNVEPIRAAKTPTKEECEKATDEYEKHMHDLLSGMFGKGYKVYGM